MDRPEPFEFHAPIGADLPSEATLWLHTQYESLSRTSTVWSYFAMHPGVVWYGVMKPAALTP